MNTYELATNYDSRNSFYGKARIIEHNNVKELYSYDTHVATIIGDDKVYVLGLHSATTLRHIKEFLLQNGFKAVNKAQIMKDYIK